MAHEDHQGGDAGASERASEQHRAAVVLYGPPRSDTSWPALQNNEPGWYVPPGEDAATTPYTLTTLGLCPRAVPPQSAYTWFPCNETFCLFNVSADVSANSATFTAILKSFAVAWLPTEP
jgi:hypothetical protein